MRIHVLGSAAGGGFPQWNCNCPNCAGLREGRIRARERTQSSIAVSGDGENWLLIDASPDVGRQIGAFSALQPARGLRDTAIRAVVLTDAQIDHATGLLLLREHREKLEVWCTPAVHDELSARYPVFGLLDHFCGVHWHTLPLDDLFSIPGIPDLRFWALSVPSKAPPYSPHRADSRRGDSIGLTLIDNTSGRHAFYAPGLGVMEAAAFSAMACADCVLVDGTFWSGDEMLRQGISAQRTADMGHLPLSGPGGMLEWLARLPSATRKLLIHINNTNPILDEDSAERLLLARAGIEVACDGLDIEL